MCTRRHHQPLQSSCVMATGEISATWTQCRGVSSLCWFSEIRRKTKALYIVCRSIMKAWMEKNVDDNDDVADSDVADGELVNDEDDNDEEEDSCGDKDDDDEHDAPPSPPVGVSAVIQAQNMVN